MNLIIFIIFHIFPMTSSKNQVRDCIIPSQNRKEQGNILYLELAIIFSRSNSYLISSTVKLLGLSYLLARIKIGQFLGI